MKKLNKSFFAAFISVFTLALVATAGSLTPPGSSVASTFHTLGEIWNSIASTSYDSSGISANANGSLIQHLKYIENSVANIRPASNSLDFDEWVASSSFDTNLDIATNNKNLDIGSGQFFLNGTSGNVGFGTGSLTQKLEIVGNTSVSGQFISQGGSSTQGALTVFPTTTNPYVLTIYRPSSTSTVGFDVSMDSSANTQFNTANADYIFQVSSGEKMRLSSAGKLTVSSNTNTVEAVNTTTNAGKRATYPIVADRQNTLGTPAIGIGSDGNNKAVVAGISLAELRLGYDTAVGTTFREGIRITPATVTNFSNTFANVGIGGHDTISAALDVRPSTSYAGPLLIVASGSSEKFRITSGGNVGIGTTTPNEKLDVAGPIEFNIASSSGVTDSFALCHNVNGNSNNQELLDCGSLPAADYMEMYPTTAGLEYGDLVMPSQEQHVPTTDRDEPVPVLQIATDRFRLMGVISRNEDATDFNAIGHNIRLEDRPLPMALVGRVAVKVNLERGPIAIGDPITLSSTPGVGTKATTAGPIVGTALQPLTTLDSGSFARVLVFVKPTYWAPSISSLALEPQMNLAPDSWDWNFVMGRIQSLFSTLWNITIEEGLLKVARGVFGEVQTDKICVGATCATEEQFKAVFGAGVGIAGTPVPTETPVVSEPPTPVPTLELTPTPEFTASPILTATPAADL